MWANSDRVTKVPVPGDLPAGVRYTSDESESTSNNSDDDLEDVCDTGEYVIDHIFQHNFVDDELRFRVTWFGYDREADTWEPWSTLPEAMVNRCLRRRHVL
jgi:Chromo (CHRromatin Organisation MOdifier) domain